MIGLDRAAKRNAFDVAMMAALVDAYDTLEGDSDIRCGVLYAVGDHFTGGVNLPEYAALWAKGENPLAIGHGHIDPMGLYGANRRKPVVSAIRGRCYTIGIELALNTDIRVAAENTQFAQMEVQRGLYPVGGATLRFVHETGYGNAMRHLLTGDEFGAAEAFANRTRARGRRGRQRHRPRDRDCRAHRADGSGCGRGDARVGAHRHGRVVSQRRRPPDSGSRRGLQVRGRARGHRLVSRAPVRSLQRALNPATAQGKGMALARTELRAADVGRPASFSW